MEETPIKKIALQFNTSINKRDLEGLASFMAENHVFIDTEGHAIKGKNACVEAWQGFFQQFPDYKNIFKTVTSRDDLVLIIGYSTCSFEPLNGPALWTAKIQDDKVVEWRVYTDTEENRKALKIE